MQSSGRLPANIRSPSSHVPYRTLPEAFFRPSQHLPWSVCRTPWLKLRCLACFWHAFSAWRLAAVSCTCRHALALLRQQRGCEMRPHRGRQRVDAMRTMCRRHALLEEAKLAAANTHARRPGKGPKAEADHAPHPCISIVSFCPNATIIRRRRWVAATCGGEMASHKQPMNALTASQAGPIAQIQARVTGRGPASKVPLPAGPCQPRPLAHRRIGGCPA